MHPATQFAIDGTPIGHPVTVDPVIGQIAATVFGAGTPLFLLVTIVRVKSRGDVYR